MSGILDFTLWADTYEEYVELLKKKYRLDSESLNLSDEEKRILDEYAENRVRPEDEEKLDSILGRMYDVKVFDPESEEY